MKWWRWILALAVATGASLSLGGATPAAAAVIAVTTTDDVVLPFDGVTSLREAMVVANGSVGDDVINLAPGLTYQLTDCAAGALVFSEDATLVLNGNGATIEQTCADERLFEKPGPLTGTLELHDLTLTNDANTGAPIQGAAVQGVGFVVLDGVDIQGIDANPSGSILQIEFAQNNSFEITIRDSNISNNTGVAVVGVFAVGALVEDSTISHNTGSGLSFADGSPITINRSNISNNGGFGVSTSGQGPTLQNPVVNISDSTIADNDWGGFKCSQSCLTVNIFGSQITGNGFGASLPGLGGGISTSMQVADFGSTSPEVNVVVSTVSNNRAPHDGAGLLVTTPSSDGADVPVTRVVGSTFSGNQTDCEGTCDGGAIAVKIGDLEVVTSTVSDNEAQGSGGAVFLEDISGTDTTSPTTLTVAFSSILDNTASGGGGGVAAFADDHLISDSTVSGNTAGPQGGGLLLGGHFEDFQPGSGVIERSTIAQNTAATGGGISIGSPDGSSLSVESSTVHANVATGVGGGIAVGPTEVLMLDQATITQNQAPTGANLGASGQTSLTASVVAEPVGGVNCAPFPVFGMSISNLGYSWFDEGSCGPLAPTDLVGSPGSLGLGPLTDNGGLTATRLPLSGSPLIESIPSASCGTTDDQRSAERPGGDGCERGSVELGDLAPDPLGVTILDEPCTIYDSATAFASLNGAFVGGETRTVHATGVLPIEQGQGLKECVPVNANAVVVTAWAEEPMAPGNLRLSAHDVPPGGGVVNYSSNGVSNANTVTIELTPDGLLDVSANNGPLGVGLPAADVRLTVVGYHEPASTLRLVPVAPCAIADSRPSKGGDGAYLGPFDPASVLPSIDLVAPIPASQGGTPGGCGVPASAEGVVLSAVAVGSTGAPGHLSVGPAGSTPTEPLTPFAPNGMNNATTTMVNLDATGRIELDVAGLAGASTHTRIVVLGYLDDASGAGYVGTTSCAAFDSRASKGATGLFAGPRAQGSLTTYQVTGALPAAQGGANGGSCEVPNEAAAVLLNLVAINPLTQGNLRAFATGSPPTGGVVNFAALSPPMSNSNAVVIPVNSSGTITVEAFGGPVTAGLPLTDVRGVVLGYFIEPPD